MFQHLSNPEYVHVLLNPLPVYGLATGVVALLVALITRSSAARVTSLALIFLCALSAWPVYHYGEAAYDRVTAMTDVDGGKWLDEHQRRAEKLIYVFYATAGLAAAGILAEAKFRRAAVPLSMVTLLLACATLGVGGYIAYAGGHVRHKEFRYELPPAPTEPEEHAR